MPLLAVSAGNGRLATMAGRGRHRQRHAIDLLALETIDHRQAGASPPRDIQAVARGRERECARMIGERHERRRGVLVDLDRRVLVLYRRKIGVRTNRCRCRDHPDPPVSGRQGRRHRAGPDNAEDRQVVAPPEIHEGDRRRGVAGDDDRLDVAVGKRVEGLRRESTNLRVRTGPVRCPGVIPEVDRRFVRRSPEDLAEDGQPANPGVEDADRTRIRHQSSGPTACPLQRPCQGRGPRGSRRRGA